MHNIPFVLNIYSPVRLVEAIQMSWEFSTFSSYSASVNVQI